MPQPARMGARCARALGVALFFALCVRVHTLSLYRGSKVIELDVTNFWRYTGNVSDGEVSVVEAYVSWCPHCQRMAPAYRRFAAEAEPWAPAIHVTAVDCVAHDLLCRDLGVWGYPTLFLFGDLRPTVEAIDNVYSRIKHEGAFAEGYPAHAIHELWQWTLSWASPRTERVSTPHELTLARERAHAAGVPIVLFIRSDWDPSTEQFGAPPPPLAPTPAVPPPSPAVPPGAASVAPNAPSPPAPPEDILAPLFGDWVDEIPADDDPCALLTQPACLEPAVGCEPVIDCWNAHWPSSCHWWHEHDGWDYDVLRAAGCPCRCRSPSPPPLPSPPPPPPRAPPSPPSPPSPPLLEMLDDAMLPAQQVHLLVQLAYELAPMRFAEWVGPPVVGLLQRFGLDADETDLRMPAIAIAPDDGSGATLYPFDEPRYAAVASWLASFQGGRKRGGLPTVGRSRQSDGPSEIDSGALIAIPPLASTDAPPAWPLPDAELRATVMYSLESFPFAGRQCLAPLEQSDLAAWIDALSEGLSFESADAQLLRELAGAVRLAPRNNLCFRDWAPLLRALRQSGFGAPHNLGDKSSACARGTHSLTCTLWVAFHTLLASSTRETAPRRLGAIHGFIRSFFACHECVSHFAHMAAELDEWLGTSPPPSKRDVVLWLWRAHNTVTVRVGLMDAAFADAAAVADAVAAAAGTRPPPAADSGSAGGAGGGGGRAGAASARPVRMLLYPTAAQCPQCYAPPNGISGESGYFEKKLQADCPLVVAGRSFGLRGAAEGEGGAAAVDGGGNGADVEEDVGVDRPSTTRGAAQPPVLAKPGASQVGPCDDSELRAMRFRVDRVAEFLDGVYSRPPAQPRVRPPSVVIWPPQGAAGVRERGRDEGNGDGAAAGRADSAAWSPRVSAAGGSSGSAAGSPSDPGAAPAVGRPATGGNDGRFWSAAGAEMRFGELRPFPGLESAVAQRGVLPRGQSERGSPIWLLLFVSCVIGAAAVGSWVVRKRVAQTDSRHVGLRGEDARFGAYRDDDDNGDSDGELDGARNGTARRAHGGAHPSEYASRYEVELSSRPAWEKDHDDDEVHNGFESVGAGEADAHGNGRERARNGSGRRRVPELRAYDIGGDELLDGGGDGAAAKEHKVSGEARPLVDGML